MLIDTHCHLDFHDFDTDRDEVISRAAKAGVVRIVNVGSSIDGSKRSVELARKYDTVYASVGIHPHEAQTATDAALADLKALASGMNKVVAVGEVGLDYYRNLSPKDVQKIAFSRFIRLASELKLPLIVHSREADDDLISIIKAEGGLPNGGVVHCFSGGEKFLRECLDLGLFVSFTCNLTFKKADELRRVAKLVPVERTMLETDAPYLAPQELRGKRNEPAYLTHLVDQWSKLCALSKDDIARITTHNANKLFGLNLEEPSKIAYPIRDSLYLNITRICTNNCFFCVRGQTGFVKGHNLVLDRDPSVDEIVSAMGDYRKFKEIVFCGYGEPTARLDAVKAIAARAKADGMKVRLVTNGHGDLINKRPIVRELIGLIDRVSVSLNAETAERYYEVCKPSFGLSTYQKVVDFIKECVSAGLDVEATCLDLPGVDVKRCEEIAASLGAKFRLRHHGVVG